MPFTRALSAQSYSWPSKGRRMALILILLGILITGIGAVGVAQPQRLVAPFLSWQPRARFYIAVGTRLVLGAVFVLAASGSRFPTLILTLGVIAIAAAICFLLLGPKRVEVLVQWWFKQSSGFLRSWFVVAILFGAFLVYSGF